MIGHDLGKAPTLPPSPPPARDRPALDDPGRKSYGRDCTVLAPWLWPARLPKVPAITGAGLLGEATDRCRRAIAGGDELAHEASAGNGSVTWVNPARREEAGPETETVGLNPPA